MASHGAAGGSTRTTIKDFRVVKRLGKGAFGEVYKVRGPACLRRRGACGIWGSDIAPPSKRSCHRCNASRMGKCML